MSFDPAALHWLRPQWLWALLALPLLAAWWRVRRRRLSAWQGVVDPHLLPRLLDTTPGRGGRIASWLALAALGLGVLALAGPSWQRVEQPLWQTRAPLVLALDLSSATLAADLPPSRLLQARARIAALLHARAGGQVGLVAFADDAYTVAPLTDDSANVAVFLDALAPDVMPVDGSRADRAIAWSATLLRRAGFSRGDIVLFTDHADLRARAAAATAAGEGYRVSVLGLGTPGGGAYRDADGRIAQARLDAASLQALAAAGEGRYAPLGADGGDALGLLDPRQAGAMAAHGEKTALWRDQGYWLLPLVLLLALFAFRRGGAFAALLLCASLPCLPAQAADGSWWQRPDQQAHARLERGAEAYRKGDFAGADAQWRGLPGADAAYDRGNALARQGRYEDAIAEYDRALRLHPGMADAIANRKAVEAAMKRKPRDGGQGQQKPQPGQQGGQQDRQDQQGGQGKPPGSPQDGQQDNPQQNQGRNDARQQPQGNRAQEASPTPPDKPADTAAQRAADAAQRERMQQALRAARQGQGGKPVQAKAETAADRERRLANEAWLRRVPDDPGALLRARFRLEYERRQQGGQ